MNQHITIEQALSLTDQQVCKLNTLIQHGWNISEYKMLKMTWQDICKDTSKFCTIGKMIEILSKHETVYNLTHYEGNYCLVVDRGMGGIEIENENLSDTLFSAIKMILETKI